MDKETVFLTGNEEEKPRVYTGRVIKIKPHYDPDTKEYKFDIIEYSIDDETHKSGSALQEPGGNRFLVGEEIQVIVTPNTGPKRTLTTYELIKLDNREAGTEPSQQN